MAHLVNNSQQKLIRLSMACVNQDELKEIEKVLFDTVNFGIGKHVEQFERAIQNYLETEREVVAVNSGTAALHVALAALNLPVGAEILVPSITFVSSYAAITACGLVPVSCDVVFPSCHIDVTDAAKRLTSKTAGIMPVAYSGSDFDREGVYKLAEIHNLRVIEDDAQAFGSLTSKGEKIGAVGDIVCFSFDGIKNITCGEGGAVVIEDKTLAHRMRVIRAMGIEKDVSLRYQGQRAWDFDVSVLGFRYHMSNLNGAMGCAQIRKIDDFKKYKTHLVSIYLKLIEKYDLTSILTPAQKPSKNTHFHIYPFVLSTNIQREPLRTFLREHQIESGFHYAPNHLHTLYRSNYALPTAEDLAKRLITLPFHQNLSEVDIERVVSTVKTFVETVK